MKPTAISDRLRDIIADIEQRGSVNLARLTVMKKWLEVPRQLSSFGVLIACGAAAPKTRTTKKARDLLDEAHILLDGVDEFSPKISRKAAERLRASLRAFQNEYRNIPYGRLRLIRDRNLFLIECGLGLCLGGRPTDGYRLAAYYCQNYNPRYGNGLNGPSRRRIEEIIAFIERIEAVGNASSGRSGRGLGTRKTKVGQMRSLEVA